MTEVTTGRRRLGRGLEALLGPTRDEAEREGSLVELAIGEIRPNPFQPRRDGGYGHATLRNSRPVQVRLHADRILRGGSANR